jgi:hypothetical protein
MELRVRGVRGSPDPRMGQGLEGSQDGSRLVVGCGWGGLGSEELREQCRMRVAAAGGLADGGGWGSWCMEEEMTVS